MNILFLMTDQHRVDTLGCYGGHPAHTPALDRLAGRGTVFDAAYTPSAICTPARASLLTGRYPFEHGMVGNFEWSAGVREDMDPQIPTFADDLIEQDYRLAHVGKWHVGKDRGPADFGFDGDHIPGALNNYADPGYQGWLRHHGYPQPELAESMHSRLTDGTTGHLIAGRLSQPTDATFEAYLTEQIIARLRKFAADPSRPFFLSGHYFGPHLPYLLPDYWYDLHDRDEIRLPPSMAETFAGKPPVQRRYSEYWGADTFDSHQWRELQAVYRGYVSMIDHHIGTILSVLDEVGLAEATAVCFTADHGEFTGAHRLNDKGPAMYEDIYRIPALLHVPGQEPGRAAHFVSLIDYHATILDLAGADPTRSRGSTLCSPPSAPRRYIVAEFHGHHFSYAQRMIRDERYKLIVNPESVDEFYDLHHDPHELHNLVSLPQVAMEVARLRTALYDELVARGDRFAQWLAMTGGIEQSRRVRPETAVEGSL